jgi:predicted dehydrogenase
MKLSRRGFVKSSLVAGTALALPASAYGRIMGTNDRVRIAVIGLHGRGKDHYGGLKDNVVALCDCDQSVLGQMAEGKDVQTFVDFRKLLDRREVDAVTVATPNHTHSLIAISALMAGKHVYVEKPVSHNVWEGRQLAKAAARYERICQCGTQSRSSPSLQQAVEFVRAGKLGKIQYAIGTCYKPRMSIGRLDKPLQIPADVDYELWCGPAEKRYLFRPQLHYDWHWDFNTGNGDMGNQGIHQMDIARWFLGENTISPRVLSIGGRLGYEDAGDTPNTQTVIHDYSAAPLIFETRGLPRAGDYRDPQQWGRNMDNYRGSQIGVIVQCADGYVVIPDYTSASAMSNDGEKLQSWDGGGNHYQNFLDAINAGDSGLLNAPVIEGHLSSALCHTGGLSHQLGERLRLPEILQATADESPVFRDSIERMVSHLRANEIDADPVAALTLGAELRFDPATETAIGNERASAGLSRAYRTGFEVTAM